MMQSSRISFTQLPGPQHLLQLYSNSENQEIYIGAILLSMDFLFYACVFLPLQDLTQCLILH